MSDKELILAICRLVAICVCFFIAGVSYCGSRPSIGITCVQRGMNYSEHFENNSRYPLAECTWAPW
jgi:hypothetical protein